MAKYEALITDLDGTAVEIASDGSDVSDNTRLAISKAQRAGFIIAAATGRSWNLAKPVIEQLGITSACVIEGGTRIIDPTTDKTLWEKHLEASSVARIVDIFKAETSEGMLLTHDVELHKPLIEVETAPETARVVYLLGINSQSALTICEQITETGLAAAHTTISWSGEGKLDVHVTHPEATKEHAITVWQDIEGVTKANTIGMGDSGNDLPLLQSVGFKVAVGNATEEVMQVADFIAPSQNDDALAYVIGHFLLGEAEA